MSELLRPEHLRPFRSRTGSPVSTLPSPRNRSCTAFHSRARVPVLVPAFVAILALLAGCSERDPVTPEGTSPDPPSRRVGIPTGGAIVFPPGALEGGVEVSTSVAAPAPPLGGVEPVGEWFRIEIDGAVSRPAELRLPIPFGEDPQRLAVIQVEDDGTQIVLSTEAEGDSIVARTPGTGTSSIYDLRLRPSGEASRGARFIVGILLEETFDPGDGLPELSPPSRGAISGPRFLSPGGRTLYSLEKNVRARPDGSSHERWTVVGGVLEDGPEPHAAWVSRSDEGVIDLMVDYICTGSGTRGFAAITISVQEGITETEALLVIGPASAETNDRVLVWGHAGFAADRWTWDFGDGTTGDTTLAEARPISVILEHFYSEAGDYTIAFTAESDGLSASSALEIEVDEPRLEVVAAGPRTFGTGSSEVGFRIRNGRPPYTVWWQLDPGFTTGSSELGNTVADRTFSFDQPGTYYVSAFVLDDVGEDASFTGLVTVTGAEELRGIVSATPDEAFTGERVTAKLTLSGGILVSNGVLRPYEVTIDWGDEETSTRLVEASTSYIDTEALFEHRYDEAGEYLLTAEIVDGQGGRVDAVPERVSVTARESYIEAFVSLDATGSGLGTVEFEFASDFLSRFTNGCQTGCLTALAYDGPNGDLLTESRLDLWIADNLVLGAQEWGGDIDRGGTAELYFTTPRTMTTPQNGDPTPVVWELVPSSQGAGTITVEESGTAPGSRVRGTFVANVRGMQSVDGGPAEEVSGTITGSFDLIRP